MFKTLNCCNCKACNFVKKITKTVKYNRTAVRNAVYS